MEAAPARVPARVCKLLGRPAPLPGSSRHAVGKEKAERQERKKRGRVNPRDSRSGGAARASGRIEEEEEEEELAVEEGCGALSLARQPAGPWAGELDSRRWNHVPALAPGRHPAPPAAGPAARAPQVPVSLRRVGVRVASAKCPALPLHSQRGAEASAGRVDLPAAKTFIMGWTPEGLGGDLRCRQFSEVHAQMGNLPDLYTAACVVRQRNGYI